MNLTKFIQNILTEINGYNTKKDLFPLYQKEVGITSR